jgi:hypothetical protein
MTFERQSLLRRAEQTRALAARTRRLMPQLPSHSVRAELAEFASHLDDRAHGLEREGAAAGRRVAHQPMILWRLLPAGHARSRNWTRSLYDGAVGPVVVRARTPLDARFLAAEEFDQAAPSASGPLNSPWLDEADTTIEACSDSRFAADGSAAVLHPSRAHVTGCGAPQGRGGVTSPR